MNLKKKKKIDQQNLKPQVNLPFLPLRVFFFFFQSVRLPYELPLQNEVGEGSDQTG